MNCEVCQKRPGHTYSVREDLLVDIQTTATVIRPIWAKSPIPTTATLCRDCIESYRRKKAGWNARIFAVLGIVALLSALIALEQHGLSIFTEIGVFTLISVLAGLLSFIFLYRWRETKEKWLARELAIKVSRKRQRDRARSVPFPWF